MSDDTINDISDTALWIAGYRAKESARPDAAFNDFLAERLAGERGIQMAENMQQADAMAFAMVVRTSGIDRLVLDAVSKGVDTVINLGAGLDTRPYRLALPADLKWIEVDLPRIIDYKSKLITENPVCQLKRYAVDLSDDAEREKLFQQLGSETRNALIITEGLIGYLKAEQAEKLSRSIYAIPSFRYWIMDYSQGKLRNQYRKEIKDKLKNTPIQFRAENQIAFFQRDGWKISSNINILDEADRIGKKLPPMKFPINLALLLFPKKMRDLGNKTYGYIMFGKE